MTNLLVIIADDMRYDHLPYVPIVRRLIQDEGRTFTGARCNIALCQPNRVGFLTGQVSHHHGEVTVGYGATFADHDDTVAAWLAAAGYRCALIGKYVNFYDGIGGLQAPKGWSTWRELTKTRSTVDFDVVADDDIRTIRGTYQTEYLAEEGARFVEAAKGEPWLCVLTPQQPHSPFAPHPRDLHAFSDARCRIVDVPDVSRKPPFIQRLPPLSAHHRSEIQQDFRGRLRELAAVDRLVETVIDAVDASGQLDDTVVVFTSDNGVHQGEQRRRGSGTKGGCYDVGLRVPFLVRGPGFAPGPDIDVPVYPMQDVTATALDVAGAEAGLPHQAGTSLRELVARPRSFAQRVLLHETAPELRMAADGITTGPHHERGHWKLFRYPAVRSGGGPPFTYEMYDLRHDPDELDNVASLPDVRSTRDALERDLQALLG